MNEYVGADALHPPAMSRFYRDDVGIVPYKKMHNLPDKSPIYYTKSSNFCTKKSLTLRVRADCRKSPEKSGLFLRFMV